MWRLIEGRGSDVKSFIQTEVTNWKLFSNISGHGGTCKYSLPASR
jgi:O-glycosyl hydrolase